MAGILGYAQRSPNFGLHKKPRPVARPSKSNIMTIWHYMHTRSCRMICNTCIVDLPTNDPVHAPLLIGRFRQHGNVPEVAVEDDDLQYVVNPLVERSRILIYPLSNLRNDDARDRSISSTADSGVLDGRYSYAPVDRKKGVGKSEGWMERVPHHHQ